MIGGAKEYAIAVVGACAIRERVVVGGSECDTLVVVRAVVV